MKHDTTLNLRGLWQFLGEDLSSWYILMFNSLLLVIVSNGTDIKYIPLVFREVMVEKYGYEPHLGFINSQ